MTETAATEVGVDVASVAQPPLPCPNNFVSNSFSAHSQHMESSQLFGCQELTGHTNSIYAIEFSKDGTLLFSGGGDRTVNSIAVPKSRPRWRIELD